MFLFGFFSGRSRVGDRASSRGLVVGRTGSSSGPRRRVFFFPVHTEVSTPKMTGVLLLDMKEVFAKGEFDPDSFCGESEHADPKGSQLLVSYCR